ncbi:MAG: Dabb family protein [Phycisphaerales bacterium]|nr:MAG: Dabb family protein [Phycisphaerales bacterium]
MRSNCMLAGLGVLVTLCGCANRLTARRQDRLSLAHNVYFTLNDNSAAARAKLAEDCYKYLSKHPGVTFFAAGDIVESHNRDVNVRDWDVGVHIVFKSKEHHDLYQQAPDHHKFIEENKQNWKAVRVFDTYIK